MSFQTFIFHVLQKIQEEMDKHVKITVCDVPKNNGIVLTGLTFTQDDINISPTIYLDGFYREYEEGRKLEEITEEIKETYYRSKMGGDLNMDFFTDYESAKQNIAYKLVNYEKNRELLEEVPHRKFLDFAIVYYYLVDKKEFSNASILIHNKHMEHWGTNEKELYAVAKKNTPRLLPVSFCGMLEVLNELTMEEPCVLSRVLEERCMEDGDEIKMLLEIYIHKDETGMYVLSNKSRLFGAVVMLYEEVMKSCAKQLDADLYILPSSVHEVILLADEGQIDKDKLEKMVREVNTTQIEPEEFLSDFVYYFSRKTGKITRL